MRRITNSDEPRVRDFIGEVGGAEGFAVAAALPHAAVVEEDDAPALRELGSLERRPTFEGAARARREEQGDGGTLPVDLVFELATLVRDQRLA